MKKIQTSFEHLAELWDAKTKNSGNVSDQTNLKTILKFVGNPKGLNIYEIACGNGYLSRKLKKAGAKEVHASDASPTLIDKATNSYDSNGIKYSVREGTDFSRLPKNHFDYIVIHQGIFYIKDITKLMRGAKSILKPGGSIVFNITHPLFQVFRFMLGTGKMTGPNSIVDALEAYPKKYTKPVHKHWMLNGKKIAANYLSYSRPIDYYVTECIKAGLSITGFKETPSMGFAKNKGIIKSAMPSSIVIKATKI